MQAIVTAIALSLEAVLEEQEIIEIISETPCQEDGKHKELSTKFGFCIFESSCYGLDSKLWLAQVTVLA